jgi:hypothetical protein
MTDDVEEGNATPAAVTVTRPVAAAATGMPMRDQEKIRAKCCNKYFFFYF